VRFRLSHRVDLQFSGLRFCSFSSYVCSVRITPPERTFSRLEQSGKICVRKHQPPPDSNTKEAHPASLPTTPRPHPVPPPPLFHTKLDGCQANTKVGWGLESPFQFFVNGFVLTVPPFFFFSLLLRIFVVDLWAACLPAVKHTTSQDLFRNLHFTLQCPLR